MYRAGPNQVGNYSIDQPLESVHHILGHKKQRRGGTGAPATEAAGPDGSPGGRPTRTDQAGAPAAGHHGRNQAGAPAATDQTQGVDQRGRRCKIELAAT